MDHIQINSNSYKNSLDLNILHYHWMNLKNVIKDENL